MAHNAPGHKRALNPRQLKGHYHRSGVVGANIVKQFASGAVHNLNHLIIIPELLLLGMLDLETSFQVVHCTCFHVFSVVLILCNLYR